MLGDDTDLDDKALTSETAAAMRQLASIVTDAPPLRLAPRPGTAPSRRRVRRRRAAWITPPAAAAAIIALAITLVALRSIPNGPVVPAVKPAPASGGVPTYYAELVREPGNAGNPDQIQVRETLTGKLVATVNRAAGATFAGITGTADDRKFVVDTQPGAIQSQSSDPAQQSVRPRTWYRSAHRGAVHGELRGPVGPAAAVDQSVRQHPTQPAEPAKRRREDLFGLRLLPRRKVQRCPHASRARLGRGPAAFLHRLAASTNSAG
jgi:hypothetical protein